MTENILKPCPFCGGEPVEQQKLNLIDNDNNCETLFWIECSNCHAKTNDWYYPQYAVSSWNDRAEIQNVNAEEWYNALHSLINAISDINNLVKKIS